MSCARAVDPNTLSGLVSFLVRVASSVGIAGGSIIVMLRELTAVVRISASSRFFLVKRCAFLCSSQSGECRLKSPSHSVCVFLLARLISLEVCDSKILRVSELYWSR